MCLRPQSQSIERTMGVMELDEFPEEGYEGRGGEGKKLGNIPKPCPS